MPATAWNHLVVAAIPTNEGLRCELRNGRVVAFGPEWRGQISVTDRLYVAEDVTVADRLTALHLERGGRLDLVQIPSTAAAPPKQDRHGRGFVMLDATAAQHGISKVLVTAAQIRDYFFAPDRSVCWADQPSWFEVLGIRKNSTSAEIRLAYRVRMLELKAKGSESNRYMQAQLARGLQILLDPDLRRDYLLLLEDPDAGVAFPPWTIGIMRATGRKKGELFLVNGLMSFFPRTEQRSVRLALRRFRFKGPEAVYRDARKRMLIHFDSSLLPMQWTDKWNTWAHLALGSVTVKAIFWQQTRFRRTETGFQPRIWSQPFQSTLHVKNSCSVARRFDAARAFWEHFHPHAEIVALLRARLEQETIEAQQAAEWCHAHGVRSPVEARWINWEPDYEECFYRELAARAGAVYLFRNEYLFVFDQTVVSEIPQAGHASYIFRPNTSLNAFLRSYAQTTRHAIRTEPKNARTTLGYAGRIPHLKDLSAWVARIEGTVANPVTQRATA
ncbi:MAG TPA: J domain-containing protein [Bryobacteraceae bacterium]|jgi:hypothetical protein|nr:J domain-containing protein [Bryobacteraceae bacterium]